MLYSDQSLHLRTDLCSYATDDTVDTQELPVAHIEPQQTDYDLILTEWQRRLL